MNSRQRRKEEAGRHNELMELDKKLGAMQLAIKEKHGFTMRIYRCDDPVLMRGQLAELQAAFDSDTLTIKAQRPGLSNRAKKVALIGMGLGILNR